jgi:hypothetical protein
MSGDALDATPSLAEIDALLDECGGDGVAVRWSLDRPLLPAEAFATLRRHQADPTTMLPHARRETVRAAAVQLRLQHDAFRRCADALSSGDASMIPAGNPMGSGFGEVRALLVDAQELAALLRDDAARSAMKDQHALLAVAFRSAAEKCVAAADHLDHERARLHMRDYLVLLRDRLEADEAEAKRRRRNIGAEASA